MIDVDQGPIIQFTCEQTQTETSQELCQVRLREENNPFWVVVLRGSSIDGVRIEHEKWESLYIAKRLQNTYLSFILAKESDLSFIVKWIN